MNRFWVTTVLPDGRIRGMAYFQPGSGNRIKTLVPAEFYAEYQLHEDVPAHLAKEGA